MCYVQISTEESTPHSAAPAPEQHRLTEPNHRSTNSSACISPEASCHPPLPPPDARRPALYSFGRPCNNGSDTCCSAPQVHPLLSPHILPAGCVNSTVLLLCESGAAPRTQHSNSRSGLPECSPSLKEGFPTQTATRSSWSRRTALG